jgi:hypothetical protein
MGNGFVFHGNSNFLCWMMTAWRISPTPRNFQQFLIMNLQARKSGQRDYSHRRSRRPLIGVGRTSVTITVKTAVARGAAVACTYFEKNQIIACPVHYALATSRIGS